MLKIIILIFLVGLSNQVLASNKDQIINKLKSTSNLKSRLLVIFKFLIISFLNSALELELKINKKKIRKYRSIKVHLFYQHDLLYLQFHPLPSYR